MYKSWNVETTFCTNSRHFGTGKNRHLCETFRYQDKSAPGQFGTSIRQIGTSKRQIGTCVFFFDFMYKTSSSLEPIPNFNHVRSGKDPDDADNTVTLYTTVIWHCEIERSFSAPSLLSCFWVLLKIFSIKHTLWYTGARSYIFTSPGIC